MMCNDCVQTLMDEEKRADYDSLIGFSRLAVNPFQDNSFEQDQVSTSPCLDEALLPRISSHSNSGPVEMQSRKATHH